MDIIDITHEKTMKLLVDNNNERVNDYVWALYDWLENYEKENDKLKAENFEMRNTINTLKEVIKALTHQHEDKGE
jgi:uncharacterized protein (UPF0276 family)